MKDIELYLKSDNRFYYFDKSFDGLSLSIAPKAKDPSIIEVKWKLYASQSLDLPLDIPTLYAQSWGIYFTIDNTNYKILNCSLEKITLGPDITATPRLVFLGSGDIPQIRD
jgi:hypothetical protein